MVVRLDSRNNPSHPNLFSLQTSKIFHRNIEGDCIKSRVFPKLKSMNELVYWSFMHLSLVGLHLVGSQMPPTIISFWVLCKCNTTVTQQLSKNNLCLGFVSSVDYTHMCLAHSNSPKPQCGLSVMDLGPMIQVLNRYIFPKFK